MSAADHPAGSNGEDQAEDEAGRKRDGPRLPPYDLRVDSGVKVMTDPGFMARVRELRREDDERHERELKERVAQGRRDALAAFVRTEDGHWICPSCAALVCRNGRERHLDWHGALAATAAEASEASWRGRPIG